MDVQWYVGIAVLSIVIFNLLFYVLQKVTQHPVRYCLLILSILVILCLVSVYFGIYQSNFMALNYFVALASSITGGFLSIVEWAMITLILDMRKK